MTDGYTLIWSFRNRYDVLEESIMSADFCFPKEVNFCLIDASSDYNTIQCVRNLANSIKDRKIRICESAYRSSLSEAWNLGMMLSDTRYVIFASSDVLFLSKDLFSSIKEAHISLNTKYLLVDNHAVFLLDRKIIPLIGWFDEEFVPGPHFDCDYMIRASEASLQVGYIPNLNYYSHGDTQSEAIERSSTEVLDRLPMHDFTNDRIFKEKWQSDWPGWESFKFESVKPHPPTHISQVKRLKKEIDWHPSWTKKYV